jgi:hypothetical protein
MTVTDVIIDAQAFLTFYAAGALAVGSACAGGEAAAFQWRGKPARTFGVFVAGLLWPATVLKMFWRSK